MEHMTRKTLLILYEIYSCCDHEIRSDITESDSCGGWCVTPHWEYLGSI